MKLSIAVITMNRAGQLKEALESCISCVLPEQTEFVIIDNASTDHTEETVHEVFKNCGCAYYYEKLPENLGVGGGRNYAFSKANGEYVYMLDDDAVIDKDDYASFFTRAAAVLDENPKIVSLTTQIYDTAWQKNRVEISGPALLEGVYKCLMFCGGSHFLRKSFFKEEPYLPNKYGYEELPPSMRAINHGMVNVFCPELLITHKPAVNKWDYSDEKNLELLIKGIALPYAIKKMMYPVIVWPLLMLANKRRIKMYLNQVNDAEARVKTVAERFCAEYPIREKISVKTLLRMFFDFKLRVF